MARVALLVPSTTYRAGDFLTAAERVGADVVVVSDHQQALADAMGGRSLRVDLRRPETAARELAAHGRRVGLDAIVGVDDQGVEVAALAAAALGLRHNPAEAVAATRDKARTRSRLEGVPGINQPRWLQASTPDEAARAAADIGPPVVVKPVSLSASRGVIRADSPAAAAAAAARAIAILDEARQPRRLLVERFVPGTEVAVEGLVEAGRLRVLAVFDKPDPLDGPYFEETVYVTPSRLPEGTQAAIADHAQTAVTALGLTEGPVHAEFRLSGDVVWTLEIAARTIGGLCGRTLRFGVGMPLEEVVLRHALGLPLHALAREGAAAGVMMLPVPEAGTLEGVGGLVEAEAVPGVEAVEITVPTGHRVRPLPEADRYLGFVFARGRRPGDVEAALRAAHARLDVRIAPHGPGAAPGTRTADATVKAHECG